MTAARAQEIRPPDRYLTSHRTLTVNRLKVMKRQMYGRAGIKLLRAQVRYKG
jgi:transposase